MYRNSFIYKINYTGGYPKKYRKQYSGETHANPSPTLQKKTLNHFLPLQKKTLNQPQ